MGQLFICSLQICLLVSIQGLKLEFSTRSDGANRAGSNPATLKLLRQHIFCSSAALSAKRRAGEQERDTERSTSAGDVQRQRYRRSRRYRRCSASRRCPPASGRRSLQEIHPLTKQGKTGQRAAEERGRCAETQPSRILEQRETCSPASNSSTDPCTLRRRLDDLDAAVPRDLCWYRSLRPTFNLLLILAPLILLILILILIHLRL